MTSFVRRAVTLASVALLLFSGTARPVAGQTVPPGQPNLIPYVVLGPEGQPIARAITTAGTCPTASFAGIAVPMAVRAVPSAAFPVLACELAIPPSVFAVSIEGRQLPLPTSRPQRIAVLGDTGCRIRGSFVQACNDPEQWPLERVARGIADYRPDLIIHVGDWYYREMPCPTTFTGCAGSPSGDNWETWSAEWFGAAYPAFLAAPWVMIRGDHEVCERGPEGWFRFLDPWPYQERCQSITEPYRLPFEGLNLVVVDSAIADDQRADPAQVALFRGQLERALALAGDSAWLVTHRPLYGLGFFDVPPNAPASNLTLAAAAPERWPASVQLILSGHIHLWEAVGFAMSATGRPSQWVVGHGGTLLDPSFTISFDGLRIAGELTSPASRYVTDQFGFMTFEPAGSGRWTAVARDRNGYPMVRCEVAGQQVACS
ncbi:MAG: metallophosphoesterase [Dehalococcoidia bacterium]